MTQRFPWAKTWRQVERNLLMVKTHWYNQTQEEKQEQFSNQGELGTMQQQLALKSVEAVQKLLAQVFISCWLTTELKSGHTTGWLKLGLCAHKKQHSDHVKALLAIKKNPHDTFKCPRTAMECKICWATFPPSANFCLSERFSAEKC